MKNLEPYSENSFDFHKSVVDAKYNRKDDPSFKERLKDLDPILEPLFQTYLDKVNQNSLNTLISAEIEGKSKDDLLSLYKYDSRLLISLRNSLTTVNNRKFNTCQLCTIEPIGSFDHIVPKEQFPEFVVNPINLFPSCLSCNGKKSSRWIRNGERLFLNLYFDILPDVKYLQVTFPNFPLPKFSIFEDNLTPKLYQLINSHYTELDLFTRFKENSNEEIDNLVSHGKLLIPQIGIKEFISIIQDNVNDLIPIYGKNYWKSALKLSLVKHPDFINLLDENYDW